MEIKLRDPNVIMKLSRLGSFHQSKLSFLSCITESLFLKSASIILIFLQILFSRGESMMLLYLTIVVTFDPNFNNLETICEPINPAPPVTKTLFLFKCFIKSKIFIKSYISFP